MFGKNDDTEKSQGQNRHNPATTNIRIYPLESVMGLQKALENGIEEEKLPHKRPPLEQYRRPNGQIVPMSLILRLRNSLAAMAARLAYGMQSVFARKKQFRADLGSMMKTGISTQFAQRGDRDERKPFRTVF